MLRVVIYKAAFAALGVGFIYYLKRYCGLETTMSGILMATYSTAVIMWPLRASKKD